MKYIGATDWFIRWPFIIEGIIIGVVAAVFALVLTSYGYRGIEDKINMELIGIGNEFLQLASIDEIGSGLVVFYSILGIVVGGMGSMISVRKHLKV